MNKQELAAMIAEILGTMEAEPLAKGGRLPPPAGADKDRIPGLCREKRNGGSARQVPGQG